MSQALLLSYELGPAGSSIHSLCISNMVMRSFVDLMTGTVILTLLSLSARIAELGSKLVHDVEKNPGPNCSRVSSSLKSLSGNIYTTALQIMLVSGDFTQPTNKDTGQSGPPQVR